MAERSWQIDRAVAEELAAALDWSPADGIVRLARLLPERLPTGSTAKRAAVAAGQVPPGADADDLARRVIGHLTAADGSGGVRESPSWTCWVTTTVMAALVDTLDIGRTEVAALRRVDDRSPVVDLHSVLTVTIDGSTWVCDPYFGAVVELDEPDGDGVTDGLDGEDDAPSRAAATIEPDGRWTFAVRLRVWGHGLRYRVLAPSLDRGDVHALCAVSVEHSGAPWRPYARLHRSDGIDTVRVGDDGEARLSQWSWSVPGEAPTEQASTHPAWPEAVAAFAEVTGVRIT